MLDADKGSQEWNETLLGSSQEAHTRAGLIVHGRLYAVVVCHYVPSGVPDNSCGHRILHNLAPNTRLVCNRHN